MHSTHFRKKLTFSILGLLIVAAVCLIAVEILVRWKASLVSAQQMDPGLLQYHPLLGWNLASQWFGRHTHHDYDVFYATNFYGFRGKAPDSRPVSKKVAVLGDSFTFGLGVNDSDTFVSLLNNLDTSTTYLNMAVPGYSTDQEILLLEEKGSYFVPDEVWLVVYLGNDLFDNTLPFPLQADRGKPYFELANSELLLRNTPVSLLTKSESQSQTDIAKLLYGRGISPGEGVAGCFKSSGLLKRILPANKSDFEFEGKFENELRLFKALVQKAQQICENKGANFKLALLAGRSYVEEPGSMSAALQDYFRKSILQIQPELKIEIPDVAIKLRQHYQQNGDKMFYPNDGHLTPLGHAVVAGLLLDKMRF